MADGLLGLWVGYKVHLTETCDGGHPHLITQAMTTPAMNVVRVIAWLWDEALGERTGVPLALLLRDVGVQPGATWIVPDRHHGGPPGATAGKFTVGHKSTRYQIVRDTVDQHQSSVKCRSVLLGSAQQVRV